MPRDKLLVANPIDRYKVGSDTRGLVQPRRTVGHRPCATCRSGRRCREELATKPRRPFYLVLRLYQPRSEVLKGEYALPEVVQDK